MAKNNLIIILGVVVAVLPYSGFPETFQNILFVVLGLLISFLSYRIGRKIIIGGKTNHFKNNSNFDNIPN